MLRLGGLALTILASAAIALGSPLCCLVGTGCCGARAVEAAAKPENRCCSHCKTERPQQPRPAEKKHCSCKQDVATHATAAEHVPLVAVFELPAPALPERAAEGAASTAHRALPLAQAPASHPLLL